MDQILFDDFSLNEWPLCFDSCLNFRGVSGVVCCVNMNAINCRFPSKDHVECSCSNYRKVDAYDLV